MSETFTSKLVKRIPGIIRHDFPRKLIALLFALLVWVSVNNEIGVEGKVPEVEVNGVHEMVANALIMPGQNERETDLRGNPLPQLEDKTDE